MIAHRIAGISVFLVLLSSGGLGAEGTVMTDAQIGATINAGCSRADPIEHYQGIGNRHQVLGPLWLEEPGEDRPRGVILPPYLRVYLYGRSHRCKKLYESWAEHVEKAREMAGPEVWVVLWRSEDPPSPPFQRHTTSDQKLLRPTEVRLRTDGTWHDPLWTRDRDRWARSWFSQDWDDGESLVATFSSLDHSGALHADYKVEEDGRSYLTESEIFSLTTFPGKWWKAAWGQESE